MELTELGNKIFKSKYALNAEETWEEMSARVASHVGNTVEDIKNYYQIISNGYFIPGGRILKNSGTDIKNLYNCFFINIPDSRDGIYQSLKDAAEIFAWGGGLGIRLSDIREEGSLIKTSKTEASGPLSFIELFNSTGDVIQQASRRAAEIALLRIDHPDILKFIGYKSNLSRRNKFLLAEFTRNVEAYSDRYLNDSNDVIKILEKTLIDSQLNHFNISVEIPDEFMVAYMNNAEYELKSPTGVVTGKLSAKYVLHLLAEQIWKSGDPGILFTNSINKDNMVKYYSEVIGANPCAEVNLLSYEPCDLGSIDLHKFYNEDINSIDFEKLEFVVSTAIRFLDSVHDKSFNRVERINEMSRNLRRVGLGVMGFADLLAEMEIPYNSEDAFKLGSYLSWFINFFAWQESMELAKEHGAFPLYDKDKADLSVVEKVFNSQYVPYNFDWNAIREIGFRNVSVTALAPTGSISLLCDVNGTIEPYFSLYYTRYITHGESNLPKEKVIMINPILLKKLVKLGYTENEIEDVKQHLVKHGTISDYEKLPEKLRKVFITAHEISPEDHIQMQAVWQDYVSNAISKTINLPETATVDEIESAIVNMWYSGLKSSTLYRDKSKLFQILNTP